MADDAATKPPTHEGTVPRIAVRTDDPHQVPVNLLFGLFVLAGLASAPIAEFVLDQRLGFHTQGFAQEVAMASLVGILLFGVIAAGFNLRSFGLLLAGLVVTDLAAFLGVLALLGLTLSGAGA